MSTPSPLQSDGSLVTFEILSGGSPLPDSVAVLSVTVEKHLNQASVARFVMLDGDTDTATFAISSSNIFVPGGAIVINAGYDAANSLLFSGQITAQNIGVNDDSVSTLTVECQGAVDNPAIDPTPVLAVSFGQSILTINASLSRPDATFVVNGAVKFQGSALAEPGKYITLAGLGDRFNGDYLMSAVVQQIQDDNWTTEVTVG